MNACLKIKALAFSLPHQERRKRKMYRKIRDLSIEHLPRQKPSAKDGASDFLFSQSKFSSCTVCIPGKENKKYRVFVKLRRRNGYFE